MYAMHDIAALLPTLMTPTDNDKKDNIEPIQKYLKGDVQAVERVHCYVVLQELGRPLIDYTSSMEVIWALIDALVGE
jgi:hypothetical protein